MNAAELPRRGIDGGHWRLGALAGLAGGLAEIAWIVLYSSVSAADAAAVARGVTYTFFPGLAALSAGVVLGIAIHLTLAVILGMAVAVGAKLVLPQPRSAWAAPCLVVAALIAVWAVNFQILLPLINPAFPELVPLGAGLASKVTFGVAAALVLHFGYEWRGGSETTINEIMP